MNPSIIHNSTQLMKTHCPNLFLYLSERDFGEFIHAAYEYTELHKGGTPNNNFIVTFFKLVDECMDQKSEIIRREFGYFNYLLGQFDEFGYRKRFADLIKANIFNFELSNFKNALGEIAVCIHLSQGFKLEKYEVKLPNGKNIDFEFSKDELIIFVEVLTVNCELNKYEEDSFPKFLNSRLQKKFREKTQMLDQVLKNHIYVYPIISGLDVAKVKAHAEYLRNLEFAEISKDGFQCFPPRIFGSTQQGKRFSCFSIGEIERSK